MSFCWVCSRSRSFCGDCMRSLRGVADVTVEMVPMVLPLRTVAGAIALMGERGVDGGSLTGLPEPGRSIRPAIDPEIGRREGMAVVDSPRLLVCPDVDCANDLIVTSSLLSRLPGVDGVGGWTLPLRVKAWRVRDSGCTLPLLPIDGGAGCSFSFLTMGEPNRIGAGIEDVCL